MNNDHLKQPLVLVIFGITGDLAQRKLLPALFQLAKADELSPATHILGISRREVPVGDVYRELVSFVGEADYDPAIAQWLESRTEMRQMGMDNVDDYQALFSRLQEVEGELGHGASRLYYLSIPAQASVPIITHLGETGHSNPLVGGDTPRLLVEKPFGYDYASAENLIAVADKNFSEQQIYRIDHYVAKETVQNMLTFRFQNPLFSAVWDNRHIDHISVVAYEKLGIEGRATFYEQTGALRDLIQSHLLQLLAITTMDRPESFTSNDIHARKLELLEAITPIAPEDVTKYTRRGQYKSYRAEVDNPDSIVETFARLELQIQNATWQHVPIIIETGKAMAEKRTEITVGFSQADAKIEGRNKLIFRIQPGEGITLQLQAKQPGIGNQMQAVDMDFDYTRSFNHRPAEAYERVIMDAIRGDQTLFATSAEVLASWRIVENVLEQWRASEAGLEFYESGSNGPNRL